MKQRNDLKSFDESLFLILKNERSAFQNHLKLLLQPVSMELDLKRSACLLYGSLRQVATLRALRGMLRSCI